MPETKRPLKVFLCHAHADREPVRALYNRLIKDGVDAWLDKEKLLPGQDWKLEIEKAVREADVVVVCLSKLFNLEGFRQREVRWALDKAMDKPDGDIFIIPARLEECDTPDSLHQWHWVNLFEEDGYEKLMRALQVRAEKIGVTVNFFLMSKPLPFQPEKALGSMKKYGKETPTKEKNGRKGEQKLEYRTYLLAFALVSVISILLTMSLKNLRANQVVVGSPTSDFFIPSLSETLTFTPSSVLPAGAVSATLVLEPSADGLGETPDPATATVSAALTEVAKGVSVTETRLSEITDAKGVSMVLVPSGTFLMGNDPSVLLAECKKYRDNCQQEWFKDDGPSNLQYLDAFYIDKFEVTNTLYKKCVEEDVCILPKLLDRYNDSKYAEHPVIGITWAMARGYCEWRGGRLPSEAQWEKAAGGGNNRMFPWGQSLSCINANYFNDPSQGRTCVGDTTAVGRYTNGISYYGAYEMGGNVWEWTSSIFAPYPYSAVDGREDLDTPGIRVARGGSWLSDRVLDLSIFHRGGPYIDPNLFYDSVGFRCVRSNP